MVDYELINITNYNPKQSLFKASRSDREEIRYWKCCNKENCEAYKNRKCIMFYHPFSCDGCPYGRKEKEVGYTKSSRKCGELERKAREKYPDKFHVLKEQFSFAKIGDYILLPITYLLNVGNPFMSCDSDFWCDKNKKLISLKYYTPEIMKQLCVYQPITLFNRSVIKQYQNEVLPEFLQKLKRYDNQMFQDLLKIYPEAESKANSYSLVGKMALLSTLSKGKVRLGTHLCKWDGEIIEFLDNPVFLGQKGVYYLKPDINATATIYEENTINEDTVLVD